jgi:hypothetical protein
MAEDKSTGYCTHCRSVTTITRPNTNHILHLLLTLITGGLWLIVWILLTIKGGCWRCSVCGQGTEPGSGGASVLRKCPHCAEIINAEAIKCKHCHSAVTPTAEPVSLIQGPVHTGQKSFIGWLILGGILAVWILIDNLI